MFKYRSKCKWNLLLYIDKNIVEICPNQEFTSNIEVTSKYLELIIEPIQVLDKKLIKKGKEKLDDTINNS
jgi:hypothetical protein